MTSDSNRWATPESVKEDLQNQPHIFWRLQENALSVAESLRGNYFNNTARFVADLRKTVEVHAARGERSDMLPVFEVQDAEWAAVQNEVVTFIDGGVGQVQIASRVPILLRVGSYRVRTGERSLSEREQFGYYPVILGDLEGGSKERPDFIDIVRITAELLGGLAALERTPDLRVLMFHGPLVYQVGLYAGHTPFTEHDIDLFLSHYADDPAFGQRLKDEFLQEARVESYPLMTDRADEWVERRVFEPLAWMAFLYRRVIAIAKSRSPVPIIAGVVERGRLREYCEHYLLNRVFHGLRAKNRGGYFNAMFGRTDLTNEKSLLDRLGYTDALLLSMLLRPGQYSEPWPIRKYEAFRTLNVALPGDVGIHEVRFQRLQESPFGFPAVQASYIHVSPTTEPIRVEVFPELGDDQTHEAVRRAYLYARLLPGYGFPVGLDIADKFAKVPAWLTNAYAKLIKLHLGIALQTGEISDAELRRVIVQAIYVTHRDWLLRPGVI